MDLVSDWNFVFCIFLHVVSPAPYESALMSNWREHTIALSLCKVWPRLIGLKYKGNSSETPSFKITAVQPFQTFIQTVYIRCLWKLISPERVHVQWIKKYQKQALPAQFDWVFSWSIINRTYCCTPPTMVSWVKGAGCLSDLHDVHECMQVRLLDLSGSQVCVGVDAVWWIPPSLVVTIFFVWLQDRVFSS